MPRSATSTTVARNVGSSSSSAAMTRQAQSTNRPAAISTTTTTAGTRSTTTNTTTSTTTTAARTQPTTPAPATGTTMSVPSQGVRRTRTRYPEALPSEIDEVFSGPVQGTAVIGTSYTLAASTTMDLLLPKQHLAMMDQAKDNPLGAYCSTGKATTGTNKTAAMTPERRSDRGSERVFGSNSISPDDLSTSHEAFAHPQQQQQQHALLHAMSEGNSNAKEGTTSGPACPYGLPCVHIADSLPNVLDGGFVVFTDSFVEAHPQSRIAAVTQAYRKASEYVNDESEEAEKPDAEAQKSQLQKVRTYIKEVQEQSRPLFRRRPSEIVYGTAAYLPRTAEDEEHTARQHDDASGDEAVCHTSFAT